MRTKPILIAALCLVFIFANVQFSLAGTSQQKKKGRSQPCAENLASCPEIGCAEEGSPNALSNSLKKKLIPIDIETSEGKKKIKKVTFVTMKRLQKLADDLVDQDRFLTREERAELKNLKAGNNKYSEGDAVRMTGYIVGRTHANKGESVNCNLRNDENNDFHITLADVSQYDESDGAEEGIDRSNLEFKGVVVEMVPQERPTNWTVKNVQAVAREGKKVLVVGQLFYDSKHKVNDDPDNPRAGQPKRMTLWEIHPVRKFFICDKPSGACNENNYGEWRELK